MSGFRLSFPACLIAGKHRLAPEDILLLKTHSFPHGICTSEDVVALLAINSSCPEKCVEWHSYFVESLAAFIVHRSYPQGSVDMINVAWMIRMFSKDGVINTSAELELVLHVIDLAAHVPEELRAFALDQLRIAIASDRGAYAAIRGSDRRSIMRQDVDYALRILRGVSDDGRIRVSSRIDAVLRRIEAEAEDRDNHPRWHAMMATIRLREDVSSRRSRSRWLRIVDERLAEDGFGEGTVFA